MTLEEIIKDKKNSGKTAIEIQKWLRDNNYGVSWLETKMIYNRS